MAATQTLPAKKPIFTPYTYWVVFLSILLVFGLIGIIRVLVYGLQVTGLTDQVPWGLWITLDLSAIGLGAGAFTFSAIVYLFRIKRYAPLSRIAVFVGFLGYTSAMIALAMDIGRPDRFWHPLVYWNVHSVLWEITWCVILYSTVLILEVLPIIFSSKFFSRWPWLMKVGDFLHNFAPFFAAVGLALSLLHQSSLGATYAVLSGRAIWFKPSLPVMFVLSAIAGGMSLTLLATMITSRLTHKQLITVSLQREAARLIGYILLAYLYLKLWDWAATNYYSHAPGTASTLERLQATTLYNQTFWWVEVLLGAVVPALILVIPSLRRNDRALIVGLFLVVSGVVINRWNVTLSGLVAPPEWSPGVNGFVIAASYQPTWTEVAVVIGVVAYGLLAFTLGVKYLPLFSSSDHAHAGD
jgi:molybdopterin-containing oxidoreductase family membrane subunit